MKVLTNDREDRASDKYDEIIWYNNIYNLFVNLSIYLLVI